MKNLLIIILIVTCLLSCSALKQSDKTPNLFEKIQGDWKTKIVDSGSRDRSFVFSFQDSLCAYKYPWGPFSKYRLKDDTLVIQKRRTTAFVDFNSIYYKIENFSKDSLELLLMSESAIEMFKKYPEFNNPISLYRIQEKNNIIPAKIHFYSSPCFGTCPSLALEIDSSGNILFDGRNYTSKENGHRGKLSSKMYQNILKQIRNLTLDSLKESYRAPWTDAQNCCVAIEHANGVTKICAYGQYKEPLELRILFHTLIELYKQIELKPTLIERNLFPY